MWQLWAGPDPELGLRLRHARRRAGMTQTQVATSLGRTVSTVCMWEKGQRSISSADLARYGILIHASLSDLIGTDSPAALFPGTSLTEA